MVGGSGVDTAVVNGADGAGDSFTLAAGGMDALFSRSGPDASALDLFLVEALEVYGQGGNDRLVVGDLSGTALRQIYFEGGRRRRRPADRRRLVGNDGDEGHIRC